MASRGPGGPVAGTETWSRGLEERSGNIGAGPGDSGPGALTKPNPGPETAPGLGPDRLWTGEVRDEPKLDRDDPIYFENSGEQTCQPPNQFIFL